jgi:hypothetical protein
MILDGTRYERRLRKSAEPSDDKNIPLNTGFGPKRGYYFLVLFIMTYAYFCHSFSSLRIKYK